MIYVSVWNRDKRASSVTDRSFTDAIPLLVHGTTYLK